MANPDIQAAKDSTYRRALTEAAEQVFATVGYAEAKVAEICEAAGVSLATFYKVFQGKAELHAAVHARRAEEVFLAAQAALKPGATPFQLMLYGCSAYVRFQASHPNYLKLVLREGYTWAEPCGPEHSGQRQVWEQGLELAAQVLGEGVARGELLPGSPRRHARLLVAITQVILADWVADGMSRPADALTDDVLDTLVRALATEPARAAWLASREIA
jgi:AcrR family transcriptional regulator